MTRSGQRGIDAALDHRVEESLEEAAACFYEVSYWVYVSSISIFQMIVAAATAADMV